jgi:hypothetical protein
MVGFRNQMPNFYFSVQKYGVQIGIFLFLLLPQILGKWRITGAFEIYLDGDQVIHSKLDTGEFPKVRIRSCLDCVMRVCVSLIVGVC